MAKSQKAHEKHAVYLGLAIIAAVTFSFVFVFLSAPGVGDGPIAGQAYLTGTDSVDHDLAETARAMARFKEVCEQRGLGEACLRNSMLWYSLKQAETQSGDGTPTELDPSILQALEDHLRRGESTVVTADYRTTVSEDEKDPDDGTICTTSEDGLDEDCNKV